jgi:hypothetical protein
MPTNLSADIVEFLERPATQNFLKCARHFVELLETDFADKSEFIKQAQTALIDLYATGHKLDDAWDIKSGRHYDTDDKLLFKNLNLGLISALGDETVYWEVFNPNEDEEAIQFWLVDDFEDIYRDLKIELTKIDFIGTDEAIADALLELKFSFTHHWGPHCISAVRGLHYIWYEGKTLL